MTDAELDAYIDAKVAAMPPLTEPQRDLIRAVFGQMKEAA